MFPQKPLLGVLLVVVYFMYLIDSRASALMAGANVSTKTFAWRSTCCLFYVPDRFTGQCTNGRG
jgi:hypothetical protein